MTTSDRPARHLERLEVDRFQPHGITLRQIGDGSGILDIAGGSVGREPALRATRRA